MYKKEIKKSTKEITDKFREDIHEEFKENRKYIVPNDFEAFLVSLFNQIAKHLDKELPKFGLVCFKLGQEHKAKEMIEDLKGLSCDGVINTTNADWWDFKCKHGVEK